MSQLKHIENVAIIGAGGKVGHRFVEELLKSGKQKITALTRLESRAAMPTGVKTVKVDYDDESSLISALQGQEFLVITLVATATAETHSKIVKAAATAGVTYIMPNAYGSDMMHESIREEDFYGARCLEYCKEIERLGSSYIGMVCGFWPEHCLVRGQITFGLDINSRKATFFDDGSTAITLTSLRQCGRALAALLSLPESGASPSVSDWKNKPFYVASYSASQRDMLDSFNRVLGITDKDWEIDYESTSQRYKDAVGQANKGDRMSYLKAMATRVFFPNGGGDYESTRGLDNDLIGLPKENIDDISRLVVEELKSS